MPKRRFEVELVRENDIENPKNKLLQTQSEGDESGADDSESEASQKDESQRNKTEKDSKKKKDEFQGTGPGSIFYEGEPSDNMESPNFDPSLVNFEENFNFSLLASVWRKIELLKNSGRNSTKKRLILLTNWFRLVIYFSSSDLLPCLYLSLNRLAPDHEMLEIGVADQSVFRLICETFGRSEKELQKQVTLYEDWGDLAQEQQKSQRILFQPAPLRIKKLYDDFVKVAKTTGKKSQETKRDILKRSLVAAKGDEVKFFIRFLLKKMRIGIQLSTVLESLAYAFTLTRHEVPDLRRTTNSSSLIQDFLSRPLDETMTIFARSLKRAFSEVPNFEIHVEFLLSDRFKSLESLDELSILPLTPVKPMLAKPTKSFADIIQRFETRAFCVEYKYDGERAQVHYQNGELRVYSRNSENMTEKYPDLMNVIEEAKQCSNFILDCEIVAYDYEEKKILPFQILTTRARRNVSLEKVKVQIRLLCFDILFLNESCLRLDFKTRRELLQKNFTKTEKFHFAEHRFFEKFDDEELRKFLDQSISDSCEGLMLKLARGEESRYAPSKRSQYWLKMKKDYLDSIGDSLDLVCLGAWRGRGKRFGTYGTFLLAVYDGENEEFQSCCKLGTGFSDEILEQISKKYTEDQVLDSKPSDYNVHEKLYPDVWFKASEVWEVKCADLTLSPLHTAAENFKSRGVALRFPRFLRFREKTIENCTSARQISEMYDSQ